MEPALQAWFGKVEVVHESPEPLKPGGKYIFGYAPHGLFPIGEHAMLRALSATLLGKHAIGGVLDTLFYIPLC